MTLVKNRKEILYLYDASYCNPNGDPADENKPRMDPESQINLVTDVRLKRTIRDYLYEIKDLEIFVRVKEDEDGKIQDAKARAKDFQDVSVKDDKYIIQKEKIDKNILSKCIDVRLFGATIPLELKVKGEKKPKKGSITHTGPVQFKMGRSLHKISIERIKGTGAFASTEGMSQQTFRTEYIVPYSLIAFHGIVNEHRAKETELSEEDVNLLYEGLWYGTKHLVTRSKSGQTPRLLLSITYKNGNFQISDLDHLIKIVSDKDDLAIRSTDDYKLDLTQFINKLKKHSSKIDKIEYLSSDTLVFAYNDDEFTGNDGLVKLFADFSIKQFDFD